MNRTSYRAGRSARLALAAGAAAVLLTACSSGSGKDSGDDVASLQTPGSGTASQGSGAGSGKKYKAGSKEASQAFDAWRAEIRTCVARKAEQLGIEVVEGTGKNEGDLVAKGLGSTLSKGNEITYENPLTKKWYEEVIGPCHKDIPAPEVEDDKSDPAKLAEARKKYECLRKEGLDGLHEPTIDDPALFTGEGTGKYLGDNVDPKAKQALEKCGIG